MSIPHIKISSLVMALGVILGAFGAHGLKPLLSDAQLANWKTAVLYLFIHALSMLVLSTIMHRQVEIIRVTFYLFLVGIVLFSGSIFLLSLKDLYTIPTGILGPITPIGGVLFILGWVNLLRLRPIEK